MADWNWIATQFFELQLASGIIALAIFIKTKIFSGQRLCFPFRVRGTVSKIVSQRNKNKTENFPSLHWSKSKHVHLE